jgi:hypothetical protein
VHKRKRIEVVVMSDFTDGYGGRIETETIVSTFYGIVECVEVEFENLHQAEHKAWVKANEKIESPKEKMLKIDGQLFKVIQAVQNRRRWYYQIEGE